MHEKQQGGRRDTLQAKSQKKPDKTGNKNQQESRVER